MGAALGYSPGAGGQLVAARRCPPSALTQRTPKVLLPVLDHAVFGVMWGLAYLALRRAREARLDKGRGMSATAGTPSPPGLLRTLARD